MPSEGADESCQWEDYGEYECENEAFKTIEVMGEQIPLCAAHLQRYRGTQL